MIEHYISLFIWIMSYSIGYTFLHELGHALPALLFDKGKIEMYVGSYGDKKASYYFRAGRLYVYMSKYYINWAFYGCCISEKNTRDWGKYFFITLNGVAFSAVLTILWAYMYLAYTEERITNPKTREPVYVNLGLPSDTAPNGVVVRKTDVSSLPYYQDQKRENAKYFVGWWLLLCFIYTVVNLYPSKFIDDEDGDTHYTDGYLLWWMLRYPTLHTTRIELWELAQQDEEEAILAKMDALERIYETGKFLPEWLLLLSLYQKQKNEEKVLYYSLQNPPQKPLGAYYGFYTAHLLTQIGKADIALQVLAQEKEHYEKNQLLWFGEVYAHLWEYRWKEVINLCEEIASAVQYMQYPFDALKAIAQTKTGETGEAWQILKKLEANSIENDPNIQYEWIAWYLYHYTYTQDSIQLKHFETKIKETGEESWELVQRLL